MDTGSYHKTWHRCRREVLALAARSSDEDNQADTPHTSCVDTDHQDCSGASSAHVEDSEIESDQSPASSDILESDFSSNLEECESSGGSDIELDLNDINNTPSFDV